MTDRRRTATSSFGVSVREGHDASAFYDRFRPPILSDDDDVLPPVALANPFFTGDARHMDGIADGSVALVVTSPPYFVGKQYEQELERDGVPATYLEYLDLLRDVFRECVRTLEPGGRIAVNVANLGRKPYRSLSADVIQILERDLGLLLRGELIWQKAEGATGSCAWGSFRSASNPVLRDLTERVIIASKGRFDRARSVKQRAAQGLPFESTLMTDDFMRSTLDVWSIPPESARRVGHPAPYPVQLPEQLIQLYTFKNDLVLDPFMGSGSALVAAAKLDRRYAGYDLDPEYVEIARRRVSQVQSITSDEGTGAAASQLTRDSIERLHPESVAQARTDGKAAPKLAADVINAAGFRIDATNRRIPKTGVTIDYVAVDEHNQEWYFDVAGPFTNHFGGLLRTDTVWKVLGHASALKGRFGDARIVVLTTALAKPKSEGDMALHAAGHGLLFDVINLLSEVDCVRLAQYVRGGPWETPLPGFWSARELSGSQ